MKLFTSLAAKIKEHPKIQFLLYVVLFYVLIMSLYIYLIHANLSTAPTFVYNQF